MVPPNSVAHFAYPVSLTFLDFDGTVGILDLLTLLVNWGRCA